MCEKIEFSQEEFNKLIDILQEFAIMYEREGYDLDKVADLCKQSYELLNKENEYGE